MAVLRQPRTGPMIKRAAFAVVLLGVAVWAVWMSVTAPALHAVQPWNQVTMPVTEGDVAVIGFQVVNRGREPITIVREIIGSSGTLKFHGLWISEIGGHISGPLEDVLDKWYTGQTGTFPISGHGHVIKPGEMVSLTFAFDVPNFGAHQVSAPLGVVVRQGWWPLRKSWVIRDFEHFNLEAVAQPQ